MENMQRSQASLQDPLWWAAQSQLGFRRGLGLPLQALGETFAAALSRFSRPLIFLEACCLAKILKIKVLDFGGHCKTAT